MSKRQIVHLLTEGRTADPVVLGGKGRGLAEMAALGLPVPPGFIVTTTASRAYGSTGRFSKRMQWHLDRGMQSLERASGKRFGATVNPLLVSVRSGAPVSMPGMMDTILNLGMTDRIADTLARQYGKKFAEDCFERFIVMFTSVAQPEQSIINPCQDPYEQLQMAIEAVVRSWQSPRAVAYRKANTIPDWHGTAVVIQEMVFGNLDEASCTGVVFSRNITTGQPGLYGEFLVQAQGEDVVSGLNTGRPISELRDWNPAVYAQLEQYVRKLERHYGHVVDVEFTVQSGRLYLLQVRAAKMTPLAIVTVAVHDVHNKVRTKEQVVSAATKSLVQKQSIASFSEEPDLSRLLATGLPVSPGAVVGYIAFSSADAIMAAKAGESVVLFRPDTTPDDLEGMLVSKAIITANGGATCHAAIVARGMNIVAVVGCSALNNTSFCEGDIVSVDGTNGRVYKGAVPLTMSTATKEQALFTKWVKQLRPELLQAPPSIDWASRDRQYDANIIMGDFYFSDLMASEARHSALAVDATTVREEIHHHAAGVFACYLTMAVSGELRHIWRRADTMVWGVKQQLVEQLRNNFGFDITISERLHDRAWAQHHAMTTLSVRPIADTANFLDVAMTAFNTLAWPQGYGGVKWGEIARTVRDYLRGSYTATVFVDHVFDLEHNGGVLFNKMPMFDNTDENVLRRRLQLKKLATSVTDLYTQLFARMLTGQPREQFSPTVGDIWDRGVKLALWNNGVVPRPEPAPKRRWSWEDSYDHEHDPYLPH